MRLVWTFVFALASSAAFAASPEDDYIAAREKAISAIAALESSNAQVETLDATGAKALADLEKRLSALVGPVAVKDFPAAGTINLESLSDADIGFGMLDGLRYAKGDNGPSLVATTRGLLDRWLQSRATETDDSFKLPAGIDAALKLDAFYSQAINSDAAFEGTLDLPMKKTAGADLAFARLGGWTQDLGPIDDQEVIVTHQGQQGDDRLGARIAHCSQDRGLRCRVDRGKCCRPEIPGGLSGFGPQGRNGVRCR